MTFGTVVLIARIQGVWQVLCSSSLLFLLILPFQVYRHMGYAWKNHVENDDEAMAGLRQVA